VTTQAELIIKVDSSQAAKSAATLDTLASSGAKAEKATGTLTTSTEKLGNAASAAARMLAGLGLALGTREIIQMGDAWKSAENQLRLVTSSAQNLVETQKRLMGVSNETRTGFEATANLYARLTRATSEMGLSQRELVGITTTINQSFAVSGATAAEAAAAITQLSQGLAAGALRGDEFNSVAEQAPGIMRAIADSLGMTNGELRKFAQTGGITAEIVVTALQKASASIENDFAKANMTLGQAVVVAKNNMLELVGANETLQAGMAGAGRAIIGVTTALQDSVPWVTTAKESLRFFFEDTNDAIKIIDTNMSAMFRNIGIGGVSVAEVLTLSFGSWLTNTKSLIQLVTVEVAAFIDKVQAKTENQFDADARAAAEKVVADARLSAIDAIVNGNKKELDSLFELINAAEKGKEAFEDLMAARAGATDDGLLNDANFDAWLQRYDAVTKAQTAEQQYIDAMRTGLVEVENQVAATEMQWTAYYNSLEDHRTRSMKDAKDEAEAAEKAAEKLARESEKAADDMAQNARRLRESFGEFFADLVIDGGNAFDSLLQSFKRMILEMVGQLAASGIMKYFAGGLAGGAASGALGSTLGAVAGGTGLFAAGSQFLGGLTGGAIGTNSMLATGASTAGASISAAIGAIPGWGWALMATAVAGKLLTKESTPSFNAGFLTDPSTPLGKSGQSFKTDAFASGFQPLGFYRRSTQAEAEQVIDVFRALDQTIVDLARNAGLSASLTSLRGYNETLLAGTSGAVFGAGGEDGRPGTALDQQMALFARQLIESLRGQIEDSDLNSVLEAGGVDQMIAKLQQVLLVQQEVSDAMVESSKASESAAKAQEEAINNWQRSLSAATNYLDDLASTYRSEQEAAIRGYYGSLMDKERDLHDARFSLFRSLQDYTKSLRLGDLTTLSPRQQFELAQSSFRDLAGRAGNASLSMEDRVAAAGQLQGASDAYLRSARQMFASGAGYKNVFSEVIGSLDAAKFLGVNKPFDASPYENAMLEELKKLNDQTSKLPTGIAGSLGPLFASLIAQAMLAGKSPSQIANIGKEVATDFGPEVGKTFSDTAKNVGIDVETLAISDEQIRQAIKAVGATSATEGEHIEKLAYLAKKSDVGLDTIANAVGMTGAEIRAKLAQYGIEEFANGGIATGPSSGHLQMLHGTEAVVPLPNGRSIPVEMRHNGPDMKEVVIELKALRADVARLNKISMTGAQFGGGQMDKQTAVLERIENKLQVSGQGSRKYGT
jgi:tape measure domain-containing protein